MTMRFVAILALVVGSMTLVLGGVSEASQRYARGEDTFVIPGATMTDATPVDGSTPATAEAIGQIAPVKWSARRVAEAISQDCLRDDLFFVSEEIKYLNRGKVLDEGGKRVSVDNYDTDTPVYGPGTELRIPVYVPKNVPCGDIRNWHVAVLKGDKYGVSPRLLLGIRNAENPFNDGIGYGVIAYRGTNLWTQADWSAKIVRRIIGSHATTDPIDHIGRLCNGYVGYHSDSWVRTVPYIYRISLATQDQMTRVQSERPSEKPS